MASLSFGRKKLRLLSTFMIALGLVVQPFSMIQANVAYAAPTATVCTAGCDYVTLQDAVDGVDAGGVVTLMEDVTLGSQVTVTKSLTIDGDNSYGITAAFTKTDNSNNSAIGVIGTSDVTVRDLYITDDAPATSQLHGINVYESTGVHLNGLSIYSMGRYAVVVNSSSVTIDSIYTEGNGWGGVNVDQTTSAPADVTMTGDNEHDETFPRPGLYTEGTGTTLNDNTLGHQYTPGIFPGTYSTVPNVQGHVMNYDSGESFTTIQAAIDDANTLAGHTIEVDAGTYTENVVVNKAINLVGMGASTTTIVATDGNATPLTFATSGALVSGFTLTHQYTGVELAAWNFNNNGVTFNQFTSDNTLEYSTVTLNRNGVYMNNATAELLYNNIVDNRTGINTTNTIDGSRFVGNTIDNNWTVGWVYYSSAMVTDFSTVTVTGNYFADNWYSEIVFKDTGASIGTIDVSDNGFYDSPVTRSSALPGTTSPSIDEPGFAAQKPASLGGTATHPSHSIPTLRTYNTTVTLAYTEPGPQSGGPTTGGSGGGSTSGTSTTTSSNAGRGGSYFGTSTYDDSWMIGANTGADENSGTEGEVLSGGAAVSGTSTEADSDSAVVPSKGISWYWWLLIGVLAAGAWTLISMLRNGRFNNR